MKARKALKWAAWGVLGAIAALTTQTRPALASASCNLEYREVCEVVNGGEICWPWPGGACDPIIIELMGRKNSADQ